MARKKPAETTSRNAVKVPDASSSGFDTVKPSSTHSKPKSNVNRAMVPGLLEGGSTLSPQGPAAGGTTAGGGASAIGGGSGTIDYGGCGGCGTGGGPVVK